MNTGGCHSSPLPQGRRVGHANVAQNLQPTDRQLQTGENRVTASLLAVLRSLSLDRMQRIIAALLEQSEFDLVEFQNQPSSGGEGVPDAQILSSCKLLFETKIKRNTVDEAQLWRHLARLDDATEVTKRVLLLTPDASCPSAVEHIDDERLAWASFESLDQRYVSLEKLRRAKRTSDLI